jgi:hypothetical protein
MAHPRAQIDVQDASHANYYPDNYEQFDNTVTIDVREPNALLGVLEFSGQELDSNELMFVPLIPPPAPINVRALTFMLGSITDPASTRIRPNTNILGAIYPVETIVTWWQDTDLQSRGLVQ